MTDSEMDFINAMFRAELDKFKGSPADVKTQVVLLIQEAGAIDWLIEICAQDNDPQMQEYAQIAKSLGR